MADPITEDQKGEDRKSARPWHKQLDAAAKREERWHKAGQEVICRYLDDRENYTAEADDTRRVNILWSTTETQKGMLFSRLGKPDVSRLFPKPGKDNKTARAASMVIERTLVACGNRYDGDFEITEAVEDQLLPGRGVCWLEYEPTFEDVAETATDIDEETGEEVEVETTAERVVYQEAKFCHVDWKEFRHGSGKAWKDVPWVARPLLYTKEDLERDFPDHADKIKLNYVLEEGRELKAAEQDDFKRARIWEIWYKPLKIRIYVADDYEYELQRDEDPYRLEGFFPVPRPLYGVKTASTLMPRPEFLQWQDQAAELDRVNTRIWRLLERLKYCGIYDASGEGKDVFATLGNLKDGQFIGVKNIKLIAQGAGLEAAFQVRDLAPIATAIQGLALRADKLLQYIFEVTGISDLMRGSSDPNATATAENFKANYGSTRQQQKMRDVQRFVRDLYRMKAELISEHFEPHVLEEMSGIRIPTKAEQDQAKQVVETRQRAMQMMQQFQQAQQAAQAQGQSAPQGMPVAAPQPPVDALRVLQAITPEMIEEAEEILKATAWEDLSKVLRSNDRRNYKIDVQTDLTALEESTDEKGQRIELLKILDAVMLKALQASTGNPPMANMMREIIMHTLRGFKTARSLEETIEDTFNHAAQQPAPQGESADPLVALEKRKLEADVQSKQLGIQAKQVDMKFDQQERALDLEAKREEMAMDSQMAAMKHEVEMQRQQTTMLKEQLARQETMLRTLQEKFAPAQAAA